jgi:hypothetical protein
MSTTPATKITYPTWQSINLNRNLAIVSGAITPSLNANVLSGSAEFLGDANGVPQSQLQITAMGMGMTSVSLDLSEVVTRKDGTQVTVLALLDAIGMAIAAPATGA